MINNRVPCFSEVFQLKKNIENIIWKLANVVLNCPFDTSWLLGPLCVALPQPWWLFMSLPTFCTAASRLPWPRPGTGTWLLTDGMEVHSQGTLVNSFQEQLVIPGIAIGVSFICEHLPRDTSNMRFLKSSVEFLFRSRSGKGTIRVLVQSPWHPVCRPYTPVVPMWWAKRRGVTCLKSHD